MFDLMRAATREGRVVHWQNAVGGMLGQSGKWTFADEDQAERFADYARQDGAPPLSDEYLEPLGLVPVDRGPE